MFRSTLKACCKSAPSTNSAARSLAISALSLLLQLLLFVSSLNELALELPHDGMVLVDRLNGIVWTVLGVSFLAFLPITFAIGVLTTHRFAGPVYRFEMYLKQVIRGERPGDCRLRKGDELMDLCALINEATAPLRRPPEPPPALPSRTPEEARTGAG